MRWCAGLGSVLVHDVCAFGQVLVHVWQVLQAGLPGSMLQ